MHKKKRHLHLELNHGEGMDWEPIRDWGMVGPPAGWAGAVGLRLAHGQSPNCGSDRWA